MSSKCNKFYNYKLDRIQRYRTTVFLQIFDHAIEINVNLEALCHVQIKRI